MSSATKPAWLRLAAIYCLFGYSSAAIKPLATSPSGDVASWFPFYLASVILLAVYFIFRQRKHVIEILRKNLFTILALCYVALCCLWALDPFLSAANAIRYITAALFGIAIFTLYSEEELLSDVALTMMLITVSSLIISLTITAQGSTGDRSVADYDSWQGAFTNRNALALVMNLAFPVFILAAKKLSYLRLPYILLAGLAFALIILSGSATGILVFTIIACLPLLLLLLRLPFGLLLTMVISAISIIALAFTITGSRPGVSSILDLLGKDSTLTGRTEIWHGIFYVMQNNGSRSIFGYGAQDINITTGGQIVTELDARKTRKKPGAETQERAVKPVDNLYLSLALKFGIAGCFLLVICLLKGVIIAFKEIKHGNSILKSFYIALILIMLVNGISESVERQILIWIFFSFILATPYKKKTS